MKEIVWGKTLLSSYTSLERLSSAIDGLVMSNSLHCGVGYNTTLNSANKILNLISRKKLLINLKVLVETVIDKMPNDYMRILVLKYFDKVKPEDILNVMEISRRSYFRKINKAVECFAKGLIKEGFDSSKLEEMVKGENWLKDLYESIYIKHNKIKEDCKATNLTNYKLGNEDYSDMKILQMAYSSYKKADLSYLLH